MSALKHPDWCHLVLCDAVAAGPDVPPPTDGAHRSYRLRVRVPSAFGDVEVVAQLRAPLDAWQTDTALALQIGANPTLLLRLDALPAALDHLRPLLASAGVEV